MNTRKHSDLSHEDGFTLPELVVATAMTLIIFAAALGLLAFSGRTQPKISTQNSKIEGAQIAMERISRELRQTYSVVQSPTPTASSLTINTYVPAGAACNSSAGGSARACKVVYSCSSGACTRIISELNGSGASSPTTIITGLASISVFSYTPSSAAANAIGVTFQVASLTPGEDAITVSDGVALRNVSGAVGT